MDDDMDSTDAMVDAFILAGATDIDAKIRVNSMLDFIETSASAPTTFMEVFGGRAICHEANTTRRNLNLDGLDALDIRTLKPDGTPWGLLSPTPGGGELPAMKPTRFLTSSPQMAARLSTTCSKDHQHQQLVGGRAAAAAFYPLKPIKLCSSA